MNAPASMDALAEVARVLGFELRRADLAILGGVDFDRAQGQSHFELVRRNYEVEFVEFDGTARECAAFLIGWRDLRTSVLGAVRAVETKVLPEMNASTLCQARNEAGERCLMRVGHDGLKHMTLERWEDPR